MKTQAQIAIRYLDTVSLDHNPLITEFDDDWVPVGPKLREHLSDKGWALVDPPYIISTQAGRDHAR